MVTCLVMAGLESFSPALVQSWLPKTEDGSFRSCPTHAETFRRAAENLPENRSPIASPATLELEKNVNWFQNLSIRSKVMTAFATGLAVTTLLGVFSINRLSTVNDGAVIVATNYLVATSGLSDFSANAIRYRQLQASHLLGTTAPAKAKELQSMHTAQDNLAKGWTKYNATVDAGYERGVADKLDGYWNSYVALNDKFIQLSDANKVADATGLYTGEMRDVFNNFLAT